MTFDKAGSLSSGSDLLEMSFLVLTTGHEDILKIKEMFFFFFFQYLLAEGTTDNINNSVSKPERKFSIHFTKEKKD